jgi:hypothetical protein
MRLNHKYFLFGNENHFERIEFHELLNLVRNNELLRQLNNDFATEAAQHVFDAFFNHTVKSQISEGKYNRYDHTRIL